ncbi:MAG: ABC transporter substrate-binding protein [Thermodesulfobacteriota bacterium]
MIGNKNRWLWNYSLLGFLFLVVFSLVFPLEAAENQPAQTSGAQPAQSPVNSALPEQEKVSPPHPTNPSPSQSASEVIIGLNSPELGPYSKQGMEQMRGAEMAVEEINESGGILGKQIKMLHRNSKSNPRIAKENAAELFEKEGAAMIFGGVSCAVSLALGKVAKLNEKLFFATTAYSTDLTTEEGHKYIFRESPDSRMAVKVLADHLKNNFSDKNYFYVTVDYNWGWTTEDIFRKYTETTEKHDHRGFLTKLGADDYKSVLNLAQELNTGVLVVILFGRDLEIALKQAQEMGLKNKMQIVVPVMTIDMAEGAGPEAMEGVLSTTPWYWKLPFEGKHEKGMAFVKKYDEKYKRYPSSAAASAYVILHQYREAVERAKTFDTLPVIKALEDYKYLGLKDEQQWRGFDHQSLQTIFAVRGKKAEEVKKDKYQADYYEVINQMKGEEAAITKEEWEASRTAVSAAPALEE